MRLRISEIIDEITVWIKLPLQKLRRLFERSIDFDFALFGRQEDVFMLIKGWLPWSVFQAEILLKFASIAVFSA